LPRWWPSVYLNVEQLRPPDARGLGRRVRLLTKGRLPYTIRWEFEVVESRQPLWLHDRGERDFEGRGVWTFAQHARLVDVAFDWKHSPGEAIFEANHRWAMAQGETSLKLELERRRANSDPARAAIPAPPGPVTYAAVALIGGAAVVGGTLAYLLVRARRKKR
jgi:hypothetical protein